MLEFLNKYFIVLSATAAVAASVFSMVFLTSYLAVFDWSLVWLIESSDVAKFGLMAVAIVSPLLATLSNNLNAFHGWFAQKQKGYLWVILILVALIVAGSASNIYHDIKQQTGQGTYHLMYGLS